MSLVGLLIVTVIGIFILATMLYSSGEMALTLAVGIFIAITLLKPDLLFQDAFAIQNFMYVKVITILFAYVWYLAAYVFGNVIKWVLGAVLLIVFLWSQGIHSIGDVKSVLKLSSDMILVLGGEL
ncbi:hypothetical protein [Thermococcus sp.]|uniref:hypothetical protein n=1 Tax=Thermococcus sp. TaxID=35749 RepID=UPI002607BF49|nr:hypothetical protein [Thermococcus sp.]